jgi:Putative metallopeptidase
MHMHSSWSKPAAHVAAVLCGLGLVLLNSTSNVRALKDEEPNRIAFEYVPTDKPEFQSLLAMFKDRKPLEKLQQIYSPFLLPEVLTYRAKDCGKINAWYQREDGKPIITLCYDLLNQILQTAPKAPSPEGVTEMDARIGQFLWFASHETGHAMFDIFDIPVWGHEEDAADGFAGFMLLHIGKDESQRLIKGAAWQWKDYISDYRTNREVQLRLAGFSSNHGQPEQRFYDLMCMAYGADPTKFAQLTDDGYLPPSRTPSCKYEYRTLAYAFKRDIVPHLDFDMAKNIWDMQWLPDTSQMQRRPPVAAR